MSKRKHSVEWMIERVNEYLNGEGSYRSIARLNGISARTLRGWVAAYKAHGPKALLPRVGNTHYSAEFKTQCVETVLKGELSVDECTAKYDISSNNSLRRWISEYNANRKLKDYNPRPEVYMAGAKRTTTIEERIEIVKYCMDHNRDYKGTAAYFSVSYSQVYSWVKKYIAQGEEGLADRRGCRKSDDELDEVEQLKRENARLMRLLKEKDMAVQLLKKAKEFERK